MCSEGVWLGLQRKESAADSTPPVSAPKKIKLSVKLTRPAQPGNQLTNQAPAESSRAVTDRPRALDSPAAARPEASDKPRKAAGGRVRQAEPSRAAPKRPGLPQVGCPLLLSPWAGEGREGALCLRVLTECIMPRRCCKSPLYDVQHFRTLDQSQVALLARKKRHSWDFASQLPWNLPGVERVRISFLLLPLGWRQSEGNGAVATFRRGCFPLCPATLATTPPCKPACPFHTSTPTQEGALPSSLAYTLYMHTAHILVATLPRRQPLAGGNTVVSCHHL